MKARTIRRAIVAAAIVVLALPGMTGTATAAPIPNSMSALGDSITRAFNACGFFFDCTARSWSTGDYSTVNSHYLRIKAKNSAITNKNYNDAVSGAEMVDLNGQAVTAGNRGVQYVTILIGANDACASTEAGMTPVADFRSQFEQAMATLASKIPSASIFVSSVPDIKRLWFIGKDNSSARAAWDAYDICQSMLANPLSTAQADVDRRNRVQQRVIDYNTQLSEVCALYATCKFDGNAVFNFQFTLSHMSTWDYFHPNTTGQRELASVTYTAGYNW